MYETIVVAIGTEEALKQRGTPKQEAPFIWSSKRTLERIRNCSAVKHYSTALAVYNALTWIASDEGRNVFTVEQETIGRRCGFNARTVRRSLPQLEAAGVVHISKPGVRSAATYTLLSFDTQPTPIEQTLSPIERTLSPIDGTEDPKLSGLKVRSLYKEINSIKEEGNAPSAVGEIPFEEMTGEQKNALWQKMRESELTKNWEDGR